jgi:hypothetical protein
VQEALSTPFHRKPINSRCSSFCCYMLFYSSRLKPGGSDGNALVWPSRRSRGFSRAGEALEPQPAKASTPPGCQTKASTPSFQRRKICRNH